MFKKYKYISVICDDDLAYCALSPSLLTLPEKESEFQKNL